MIESVKIFFNQNIYERVISGILFIIPFIFLLFEGGNYFVLFFTILLAVAIYEFNTASKNKIKLPFRIFIIILIIISFFHFIFLRISYDDYIIEYLLHIIFSIWIFDSFSLIGGRLIGGRKLIPKISPNKTYSGFIVGFLSLLFFSILLKIFYYQHNMIIIFTLLIGLISFIGDAIESYFKRFLKIKDFSNLMPGHGGVIDRMDAFILFFLLHFIFTVLIFNPIIFYG